MRGGEKEEGRRQERGTITPIIWILGAVFLVYFFINYAMIPNGWL